MDEELREQNIDGTEAAEREQRNIPGGDSQNVGQNSAGAAYGTSNGLFGQTDRDSGEYHFRSGHTQQVYSNAHYIPANESTVPPRYYRPVQQPHEDTEKREEPGKTGNGQSSKKNGKRSGLTGFILVLALCFLSALLGGALSVVLLTEYYNSPDSSFLGSVLSHKETEDSTATAITAETGLTVSDYEIPLSDLSDSTEKLPEKQPDLTASEIYSIACSQVVSITTDIVNVDIYGNQTPSTISGSGFLISSDGYILTNYHVVEYAVESGISVGVATFDGSVYVGTVVSTEEEQDLAIVKVDKDGFVPAVFGNSDILSVGDTIYAVGNPYGILEFTMSVGHISALDRMISTDENEDNACNMFQIDAAVFSGNSGGPVYNSRGEVVGIVSARYSTEGMEGIGFAIPINDAMSVASELMDKGYVSGKAAIGAKFDERYNIIYSRYYRLPEGAYVYSVESGGASEKAGIQSGDIIMTIGEYSISDYSDVSSALRHYKAGDTAEVSLYRNGTVLTVKLVFDEYVPDSVNSSISAYATKYA